MNFKQANRFYLVAIGILGFLFCTLLYKNISYPLLWNDETETAMTAKQILKYGYPKVHDGKNIIFLPLESQWLGYKPDYDLNITIPWGSYYFGAIGVFMAEFTNDIYLKTALVRLPYATIGLLGLILFLLALKDVFPAREEYYKFVMAFITVEMFSVLLVLHLRQVRYYSPVVFIAGWFFYVFSKYFLFNKLDYRRYFLLMVLVLFFGYQMNLIIFISCCLTAGIYEVWQRISIGLDGLKKGEDPQLLFKDQFIQGLKNMAPFIVAGVLITPFVIFNETFSTAAKTSEYYGYNFDKYVSNLQRIWYVLQTQEFLYPVLIAETVCLIIWISGKINKSETTEDALQKNLFKASFFMVLFAICFTSLIARMPFLWERYFIVLQPITMLILLVNIFIIFKYIGGFEHAASKLFLRIAITEALVVSVLLYSDAKIQYFKDYLYQINNQYKGPLDYLVPYIKENYKNPENLVLATNYEELSYVYYLDCKVVLGYMNKNLQEDLKYQPDILIFRKHWMRWGHDPALYNQLLTKARYKKITFPVYDSEVNDIAELDYAFHHEFKTLVSANEADNTDIFVKEQ